MDLVKVTFKLPESDVATLKRIAACRNETVTATVRRAIAMEQFTHEALSKGAKLLIERPDQGIRELVIQ